MFAFIYALIFAFAALQLNHFLPLLPERVAVRFDFDGSANGWMTREGFAVFYLAFLGGMMGFIMLVSHINGRLSNRFINIPNKDYWLAPGRRAESLKSLRRMTLALGAVVGLFIVMMMQLVISANLAETPALPGEKFWPLLGLFAAFILSCVLYSLRRFRKPGAP